MKEVALGMVRQAQRDDSVGLSAELAYRWFLTLFPLAIVVAGLGAVAARQLDIQNPAQLAKDQLTGLLPSEAATLIGDELQRIIDSQDAGVISFGMIAAIWVATGGTQALIKAMNRAYDVTESRPLWRRYPLAIGLTLVAGLGVIVAVFLFGAGAIVASDLGERLGIGDVTAAVIDWLRWPVAGAILFVAVAVLYRVGPNIRLRWTRIVPGAVVFVLGWLAATFGFGLYVANFTNYGATLGALAGVAVLLVWLYITALVLLVGAELNDVLAEVDEPDANQDGRDPEAGAGPS